MSGIFGKKQVLLATLILALGVAVYLNYYFSVQQPSVVGTGGKPSTSTTGKNYGDAQFVGNNKTSKPGTSTTAVNASDYFVQARQNREKARDEAMDMIKDMMNDVKATDAIKQEALEKIDAIAKDIERESKIENLIKAKGFKDCVVYIEDKSCHVVVRSEGLQPQEAVQITEIITTQSEVPATNINILTVK